MGSALRQGNTKFIMRKEAERAALRALREAVSSLSATKEELDRAKTFDDAMSSLGWRVLRNGEGVVRGLRFSGNEYQGNEEPMFEALAAYVEPGSVVDVWFDETPKRFKFTGRTLVERRIKPDMFQEFAEDEEAPPPSRVPVFDDVVKGAPESRRAYAPKDTFDPGEWIEHPKFGAGLVMKNPEPGKVRVLFKDGERVLLQGR